jgi:hypothetical protein
LRLQSIEVGSKACLVHLVGVKGLVKSLLKNVRVEEDE